MRASIALTTCTRYPASALDTAGGFGYLSSTSSFNFLLVMFLCLFLKSRHIHCI